MAAAFIAGILDLPDVVRLVHHDSRLQATIAGRRGAASGKRSAAADRPGDAVAARHGRPESRQLRASEGARLAPRWHVAAGGNPVLLNALLEARRGARLVGRPAGRRGVRTRCHALSGPHRVDGAEGGAAPGRAGRLRITRPGQRVANSASTCRLPRCDGHFGAAAWDER
ncbi:hypothetical protein [Streptomyces marianii]|uniref:hypothetical protein n=1 Tax=Streptomyces marianii TaxID=1817406 RepID=UPI002D77A704|nr:hypothetical protein [Streptomyces marianii]